jgi:GTPase SAR1 family protein
MREQYMREGEGFILVYSITERESFDSIGAFHEQLLRVKEMNTVPIILVGNKCDLEYERRVAEQGLCAQFHPSHLMCLRPSLSVPVFFFFAWGTTHRRPPHRSAARMSFRRNFGQTGNQRKRDVHGTRGSNTESQQSTFFFL